MADKSTTLSCRTASYAPFEACALEHIASLGLRYVEIPVPPTDAIESTAAALRDRGLRAATLHGECDLSRPDVADAVLEQMPAFEAFGCRLMFTSAQMVKLQPDLAYDRLRAAGEVADAHGVTIVLETHPDLVTNADVALQTMQAVNHPRVRLNFDTANLYFYNREIDCVDQLRRLLKFVAAVHLKDTDGGYRHWHFPALGEGIVDFPAVFELLDGVEFRGPYTLEIEGLDGEEKTEQLITQRVAASVEYLRKLNRV